MAPMCPVIFNKRQKHVHTDRNIQIMFRLQHICESLGAGDAVSAISVSNNLEF